MTEPTVIALDAMYRFTHGDTSLPIPINPTLEGAVAGQDLGHLLDELLRAGHVRVEPPNLVFLTPDGVRALFIKQAHHERRAAGSGGHRPHESQDIMIEEPEEAEGEDEVDLGAIMDLVRDGRQRSRSESGIRPPPVNKAAAALSQLDQLQAQLDGLTKELALNSGLSLAQWTQALELRAQVSRLLETIRRIVQPRR